jgi:transposase
LATAARKAAASAPIWQPAASHHAFHQPAVGKCPSRTALTLYRQHHRIEIMFARLKDWRRIATHYDRCAQTFFSAITPAATVIFWLEK